jgi:hypothetical protein
VRRAARSPNESWDRGGFASTARSVRPVADDPGALELVFFAVPDEKDRADLIEYLTTLK